MSARSYRKVFAALAVVGLVLDQVTKYSVFRWLYNGGEGGQYRVFSSFFELESHYTRTDAGDGSLAALQTFSGDKMPEVNHGALFGLLGDHRELANALFAIISLLAAVVIFYWSTRPSARRDPGLSSALGLILAGTLGNLYDRLVFGGVRDFLHFHYNSFDWPVFNIADCCLVCGAGLLLTQAFFGKKSVDETQPAASTTTQQAAPKQEMVEAS